MWGIFNLQNGIPGGPELACKNPFKISPKILFWNESMKKTSGTS